MSYDDILSTQEVAKLLKMGSTNVTKLCRDGVFGKQYGRTWIILRDEVTAYQENPPPDKRGNPNWKR